MNLNTIKNLFAALCLAAGSCSAATHPDQATMQNSVDAAIKPLLEKYQIAGMAVAVSVNGANHFFNYGLASRETKQPVTATTLFEIGSISKTFTASLASYAQLNGQLNLSDPASKYLPELRGSSFDQISLLNLGTHTGSNFPLQVPEHIHNDEQLMDYFKNWQPAHPAGVYRTYSNPGIGLLGLITARSMQMPFDDAMEKVLLPALGMKHSYLNVPADQMRNYAQGYSKDDALVRVTPGQLGAITYGIKTDSTDLLRYLNANMQEVALTDKFQRALIDTHTGYFKAGKIIQDLMWEQYPDTAPLAQLVAGNSSEMIFSDTPVIKIDPPLPPQANVLLNKTGSTNGFGAYVLFAPARKIGIVMLANRSYPIEARVTAAYEILKALQSLPEQ
ncbi:beta-lactamase class C [Oxalobacteraceae bacterium GrIS 2.11]